MKEACKVVAILYDKLEKEIKVGMSTWEVDQIAEKIIRSLGAIPAEKGYDVAVNDTDEEFKSYLKNKVSDKFYKQLKAGSLT